jgi:MFS family permease
MIDNSFIPTLKRFFLDAYLPMFLFGLGLGFTTPVLPIYIGGLGASMAMTGTIIAVIGAGSLAGALPAGSLVSRFGAHLPITISAAVIGASALMIGLTQSIWLLIVLLALIGISQSVFLLSLQTYVRFQTTMEGRGRALSLVGGVIRTANLFGPLIGGFLGKHLGLSSVFFAQAACAFGAALLLLSRHNYKDIGKTGGEVKHSYFHVVKENRKIFLTTGFVIIVLTLLRTGREILVPLWGASIGLDVAAIGIILGIGTAVELPMVIPSGMLMDRMGRKWAAGPCVLLLSIGIALVPLTGSFIGLTIAVLVMSIGNGFGSGIVLTLGADATPKESPGEFLGVLRLIGNFGKIGAPLVVGIAAQIVSLSISPFILAGIGGFGLYVLLARVKETGGSRHNTGIPKK